MSPSGQRRRLGYCFPHHYSLTSYICHPSLTMLCMVLCLTETVIIISYTTWNSFCFLTLSHWSWSLVKGHTMHPYTYGRSVFITTIAIASSLTGMHLMHLYLSKLDGRLHRSGILTKHSHSFGRHVYWWVALFYLILPRLFLSLGFSE